MARDGFGIANSFSSAFMQGFSFVDDINRRNRAERRLEEEIAYNRRRQNAADARARVLHENALEDRLTRNAAQQELRTQRNTLFNQGQDDRADLLAEEELFEQATAILADPEADLRQITPDMLRDPRVAAEVNLRRTNDADFDAFMTSLERQGQGLSAQAQQVAQGGQGAQAAPAVSGTPAQQQAAGQLADPEQLQLPSAPLDEIGMRDMTNRELNELGKTDPELAAEIRELQAEIDANNSFSQRFKDAVTNTPRSPTRLEQRRADAAAKQSISEAKWAAFADHGNDQGELQRSRPMDLVVQEYYNERSSITDPDVLKAADDEMTGRIQATASQAWQTLANPELDPNGTEARLARQSLNQSFALSQAMGLQHDVLNAAGIDRRGAPLGDNQPAAMTEQIMSAMDNGPAATMPTDPNQRRADVTMLNRGVSGGRMPERFSKAIYRRYKAGEITRQEAEHLVRYGRMPASSPKIEQWDPKKNVVQIGTDPVTGQQSIRVLQHARVELTEKQQEALDNGLRNILQDDGLKFVDGLADTYNTEDDPKRGDFMVIQFKNFLARNEGKLGAHGYRLDNQTDTSEVFTRWTQIQGLAQAYDDEYFRDGLPVVFDNFDSDYGGVDLAFFNPAMKGLQEEYNLRVPGTYGIIPRALGGAAFAEKPGVQPLRGINQAIVNDLMQAHPEEFAGMTKEQIEGWLHEKGF